MSIIVRLAWRNLWQAKRRTLLLGLAIVVVAALFLVLRAVSASVSERMVEAATTLSAGHVNVGGFFKVRKKEAAPLLAERQKIRQFVQQQVGGEARVIDRHRGWGRLVSPASSINVGVSGIEVADEAPFFEALRLAPENEYRSAGGSDKAYGNFADLSKPGSILIFAAQAKKLEVGVGDSLTLVTEGNEPSNTVDLQVVAIASDIGFMSNFNIFVPRATILDLYRLSEDTTGVVMVYLPQPDSAAAVMETLRGAFQQEGYTVMDHDPQPFFAKLERVGGEDWLGQQIDLTTWSDEVSFVLWIATALDFVSLLVVGILALIIGAGITNAMWMSVRERTREIGTMRAMGAQKRFIVALFIVEAMLLGLVAASGGVVVGTLLLAGLNSFDIPIADNGMRLILMTNILRINLHLSQAVSTLCLFTAVTGLAASYPALKAARLRPVEALLQTK